MSNCAKGFPVDCVFVDNLALARLRIEELESQLTAQTARADKAVEFTIIVQSARNTDTQFWKGQLTTETARADGLQSALSAAEKQYQDAIAEVAIYMDRAERADDLMDALTAANARADAAEAKIKRAREVLPASWLTDYFDDKPEYCNNHANMTLLDGEQTP